MKIIDLLNKIANGEEVPKKIKFNNEIFNFKNDIQNYSTVRDGKNVTLDSYLLIYLINEEIEILEEKKIPEKLNIDTDELRGKETPRAIDYLIESKINQVIDYLNSKGDE